MLQSATLQGLQTTQLMRRLTHKLVSVLRASQHIRLCSVKW